MRCGAQTPDERRNTMTLIRCPAIGIALLVVSLGSASSADVISDWNTAATHCS
jgi:hypothetical protein